MCIGKQKGCPAIHIDEKNNRIHRRECLFNENIYKTGEFLEIMIFLDLLKIMANFHFTEFDLVRHFKKRYKSTGIGILLMCYAWKMQFSS